MLSIGIAARPSGPMTRRVMPASAGGLTPPPPAVVYPLLALMGATPSILKAATRAATATVETALIRAALDDARGNQCGAARLLGVSRETIRVKIARHNLRPLASQ